MKDKEMNVLIKICRFLIVIPAVFILMNLDGIGQSGGDINRRPIITYLSGNGFIHHAAGLKYEPACLGMQLIEGDRIGTTDGRLEIELGNKNYVRLDNDTKIDLTRLPRKGSRFTQLRLWTGNAIISLHSWENEKYLEMNTPDVTAYFLDRGVYRLDVKENSETQIHVFSGLLEAAGEADSILLKKSQKASAFQGRTSRMDFLTATVQDKFFNWNKAREEQIRRHLSPRNLPSGAGGRVQSKGKFVSAKTSGRHTPPIQINQSRTQRISPSSSINRLYKYISREKMPAGEKNITRLIPEQTVQPPQKIRPPTKKNQKKKQ
jgi:hypothetical protein